MEAERKLLAIEWVLLYVVEVLEELPEDLIFEFLGRTQYLLLFTYLVAENKFNYHECVVLLTLCPFHWTGGSRRRS